jgi:tRNA A37 threonylcarbamoyladenosine dehydratase
VLKERLLTIHPEAEIETVFENYYADGKTESGADLKIGEYDFVIDAIDSVAAKADLIINATRARGVKVFCSMGAALRFDPTAVTTGELMSIKGDALAKAVRARMKKIGLHPYKKVKCVYSTEQAQTCETRGSLMQVTAVFGCTLASMVINALKTDN